MLVSNTLFGELDKVQIAIARIKEFEPPEGYYVAFSGGKDSVVILDLVKRSGVKFDAHYHFTGVDPPELYSFIHNEHSEISIDKPRITMWKLIEHKLMPPTRIIRYCCKELKEHGGKDRVVITGVRAAESVLRSKRGVVSHCYKQSNKFTVNPIVDWTDKDVWQYIKENNVKYCHLYDEGFKRLGCIGCPMGNKKQRVQQFLRWPKFEKMYRKAFENAVIARVAKGEIWNAAHPLKEDWSSGDKMFDWWMQDKHLKGNPDQSTMFE